MKAIVNINGTPQSVDVSVYHESSSKQVEINLKNNDLNVILFDQSTGGGDEYGYEYTANDLIDFLSSNITI